MQNENENVSFENDGVTVLPSDVNTQTPNFQQESPVVMQPVINEAPKEEKNDNRKKVLTAFLMLIVTAVSLTTASYAWFTENTTVTVDNIEVTVDASNGIQISTDAVTWKANITNEDIRTGSYPGGDNQLPTKLSPVSTVGDVGPVGGDGVKPGHMRMFRGNITQDETLNTYRIEAVQSIEAAADANGTAGTTGDFIAFDMFILATQATTVYLTGSSDVITSETDKGLKNAARVAFLYEGSAAAGDATAARNLAGALSHSAGGTTNTIWEPNYTTHTANGISQAGAYGQTITANQEVPSYYGVSAVIPATPPTDYRSTSSTYFGQVTADIKTPTGNGTDTALPFNIAVGINKIRVYAWIEGQDYDCENNASGSKIIYKFQISKTTTP